MVLSICEVAGCARLLMQLKFQTNPVQSEGGGVGGDRNLFVLDGKQWPTTEHYFQVAKYPQNEPLQEQIRTAPSCTAPGGLMPYVNTSTV